MHRRLIVALTLIATAATLVPGTARAASERGRYVVVLKGKNGARTAAEDHAARYSAAVSALYSHALNGYAATLPRGAADSIARDPRVAYIERDQSVRAFGEIPTGVDRMEADKKMLLGDAVHAAVDVDVAVLDTGVDASHPDLAVTGGVTCASGGPFDQSCSAGGFHDGNGHGTHVAGIAAARDDGAGAVGVAPGARLWAVKVLDDGGNGYISWIVAGIDWVTGRNTDADVTNDVEVANMSFGCECSSAAMTAALDRSIDAGTVYVAAAGNSSKDAATFSPANHARVIAVSALADFDGLAGGAAAATCRNDRDDTFADFSNFGSVVDLAAPGTCIRSTVPGGGYDTFSGTSMSSPHAAGAAALYVVENSVPRTSTRWSAVRTGLRGIGWSVAQSDGCGFGGGRSPEPLLVLALPCDVASPPEAAPPVAVDDHASTSADIPVTIAVLANDSDPNGDTLLVTNLTSPANGSVALNADRSVTYTPAPGFSGTDSFTYTANDGASDSNIATVSLSVASSAVIPWNLEATPRKTKGGKFVDITWDPRAARTTATNESVDVWRNGAPIAATANDGTFTDGSLGKGGGTYYYFLCESDNWDNCSDIAVVSF